MNSNVQTSNILSSPFCPLLLHCRLFQMLLGGLCRSILSSHTTICKLSKQKEIVSSVNICLHARQLPAADRLYLFQVCRPRRWCSSLLAGHRYSLLPSARCPASCLSGEQQRPAHADGQCHYKLRQYRHDYSDTVITVVVEEEEEAAVVAAAGLK